MGTRKADAVVIGGGAAGMMAAIAAGARGRTVIVLEHERFCGKKLRNWLKKTAARIWQIS